MGETDKALDVFEMAARAALIMEFGAEHVARIEACLAAARQQVPVILKAVANA